MARGFAVFVVMAVLAVVVPHVESTAMPYVLLQEGAPKCFYEELNPDTHVLVQYRCPALDFEKRKTEFDKSTLKARLDKKGVAHDHPVGLLLEITAPDGNPVPLAWYEGILDKEEDSFGFVSRQGSGEYSICFKTNTSHWHLSETFQLHVNFDTSRAASAGYHADKTDDPSNIDEVTNLQQGLERLKLQMRGVREEFSYWMARERRFRWTTLSTHSRVWVLAIVQILVLVAASTGQIMYLKSFLRAKKLV